MASKGTSAERVTSAASYRANNSFFCRCAMLQRGAGVLASNYEEVSVFVSVSVPVSVSVSVSVPVSILPLSCL
jgi:hypothetical protein